MTKQAHPHWSSEEYHKLAGFASTWRDTWWRPDYLRLIAQRRELRQAKKILDVGCGVGHWGLLWLKLLSPTTTLTGLEQDAAFVDKAKHKANEQGVEDRAHFEVGKAEALPYKDDEFDLVTCQTLLMHLKDPMVALQEMKRVTRPGGIVMVAEPDNLASAMSMLNGHPQPNWQRIQTILQFRAMCEQGKRNVGEGDSSIGGRLPGYLHNCGLTQIDVSLNDRVPFLLPPYQAGHQAIEMAQWTEWAREDILGFVGGRENASRWFAASGGTESDFSQGWDTALHHQKEWQAQLAAGTYHGARGALFYLVSGQKPRKS